MTLDERNDRPSAWTPDSKAVLFISDRCGNYHIYKQALDQDSAEPFLVTPQVDWAARLSPDGKWVIYDSFADLKGSSLKEMEVGTSGASQLKRVPVSGGPSQLVLTAHGITGARGLRPLCAWWEKRLRIKDTSSLRHSIP